MFNYAMMGPEGVYTLLFIETALRLVMKVNDTGTEICSAKLSGKWVHSNTRVPDWKLM